MLKNIYDPPRDSNSRPRQHRLALHYKYSNSTLISIAQLVKVTDSAVLGVVVEVVSSNPVVGHKYFFNIYRHI